MHYKQKDNLSFNSRIYFHELVYSAKIFHLAQALLRQWKFNSNIAL